MALSSLFVSSSSSVDIRFSCDNFSLSWLNLIKFHNKVSNLKRKVGIDFWGYGPTVLELGFKKEP